MFKKDKYVVIKQAISKDLAAFVANYFSIKKQVMDTCRQARYISPYETLLGEYEGADGQIPHTYSKLFRHRYGNFNAEVSTCYGKDYRIKINSCLYLRTNL